MDFQNPSFGELATLKNMNALYRGGGWAKRWPVDTATFLKAEPEPSSAQTLFAT